MPKIIAAAVTAYAIEAGVATTLTAARVIYAVTYALVTVAVSVGLSAALAPGIPDPAASLNNIKQARPPRRYGVGTTRISGALVFREAEKNTYHQVIVYPEGPLVYTDRQWLNDDEVTIISGVIQSIGGDRYETGRAEVWERVGLDTETAYSELTTVYPTKWPATRRGDGVPSTYLKLKHGKLSDATKQFPAGIGTELTREASYLAYDWRDEAQDRDDKTTWTVCNNPVVWLVNVLWRRYGADWDRRFAPALDVLTVQADICDEPVALKAGGTAPRYEIGFWFEATTARKTIVQTFIQATDGSFKVRKDGAYIFRVGAYAAPTVIFGEAEIIDYSFNPGPTPDQAYNVLSVSFSDPENDYVLIETDSWRNEDDITLRGEERVLEFAPKGVQSNSQVRRLAKAAMDRAFSPDGTFRTPLSARRGLGERYVGLRIEEETDLNDAVVEILDASIELETASIVWTYKLVTAARYDWNAATEEGDGPSTDARPLPESLDAPVIASVETSHASTGPGTGYLLVITITNPDEDRDDLTYFYRWRVQGSTSWRERTGEDSDPGVNIVLESGLEIPSEAIIEVQAAYQTGGGTLSPWSATTLVSTEADFLVTEDGDVLATEDGGALKSED